MIAFDVLQSIRNQLSEFLKAERLDESSISVQTPFALDDGDRLGFIVTKSPDGRNWRLTDEGDLVSRLSYSGRDLLGRGHRTRLERLLAFYGITHADGVLMMDSDAADLGQSIRLFAQASFEAVSLSKLPAESTRQARRRFKRELQSLISRVVPSSRSAIGWHHPEYDPDKVYRVDCRIAADEDWYVFGVGRDLEGLRAAVTIHHYTQHAVAFKSVAIYENKDDLRKECSAPLEEIVSVSFPSIDDPEAIEDFFKRDVLKLAG